MAATIVQYLGTGRRKRSVARVFLRPGTGEIHVNGRTLVISAWTIAIAISLMNVFLIYQQFFLN